MDMSAGSEARFEYLDERIVGALPLASHFRAPDAVRPLHRKIPQQIRRYRMPWRAARSTSYVQLGCV